VVGFTTKDWKEQQETAPENHHNFAKHSQETNAKKHKKSILEFSTKIS
jgi:hypothetical protein